MWNIEQEKNREKEKNGRQASEAQREKGPRRLRMWPPTMQGKNERQWKKVNENTYDISP